MGGNNSKPEPKPIEQNPNPIVINLQQIMSPFSTNQGPTARQTATGAKASATSQPIDPRFNPDASNGDGFPMGTIILIGGAGVAAYMVLKK